MDRPIVYPGQIPLETDLLSTNRNALVGLAKLCAALFGSTTMAFGLAATPDSPASMRVAIGPGDIYQLANLDSSAYSSLAADTTHQIVKQGINLDATYLTLSAPGTAGQSINYLIQATLAEADAGATVLPYYNSSNPAAAYSGPSNSGQAQATNRKVSVTLAAKAGAAAATGSQVTPAPDAGYIGLWVVTVAYGATTITAGNISRYAWAPYIPDAGLLVGSIQQGGTIASAAGGTADALTGIYNPNISTLTNGLTLFVRANLANTSTTPTFTPNSGTVAAKAIVKGNNLPLAPGDIAGAGHWLEMTYDSTLDKWTLQNPATGIAAPAITGGAKNLQASATGSSAAVSISADELVLSNASGSYKTLSGVAVALNSAGTGVNGLDTGTLAASTWYSLWVIWNGSTVASLISMSGTAPTMPAGYTFKTRVGWIYTDSTANKYPYGFVQYGRTVRLKRDGALAAGFPGLFYGVQGNITTPTWASSRVRGLSTGVALPPTAGKAALMVGTSSAAGMTAMVAPSASYGGYSGTNHLRAPLTVSNTTTASGNGFTVLGEVLLESDYLFYAGDNASCNAVFVGWEDNL
ncbi:hypothetical protein DEH84_07090 [Aquabacterium olei]|uniref:Uncharacterized protein n=1 Tax=Aquabacterium olei TaxID=1296669 RepID=A0A2U8FQ81_9BURK|nr:hypothetical protein [Aquabacterium olei]AWI53221.1 hypothetical protein DEH84_07090 [Aquabacterium olei]